MFKDLFLSAILYSYYSPKQDSAALGRAVHG